MDGAAAALDADSPDPLWRQAADLIRHQIVTGKLARWRPHSGRARSAGAALDQPRDAAPGAAEPRRRRRAHSLARTRLVRVGQCAEGIPEHAGIVLRDRQRGSGSTPSSDVLRAEDAPATLDEAEELAIAPGAPLFHLDRIRRLDGVPVAVDTSFFAAVLKPDLSGVDFRTASLFRLLIDAGIDLARGETTIEAHAADARLAGHLDIEAGKPILVMRQMIVDTAGRPMLSSTVQYVGDRYRLRTSFSRSRKTGGR